MLDAVVRQLMSCHTFCRNFVVTFVVTLSYDFLKIAFYRTFVVNLLYVVTLSYICRTTFCKLGSRSSFRNRIEIEIMISKHHYRRRKTMTL